jgi:hypothetical protein
VGSRVSWQYLASIRFIQNQREWLPEAHRHSVKQVKNVEKLTANQGFRVGLGEPAAFPGRCWQEPEHFNRLPPA